MDLFEDAFHKLLTLLGVMKRTVQRSFNCCFVFRVETQRFSPTCEFVSQNFQLKKVVFVLFVAMVSISSYLKALGTCYKGGNKAPAPKARPAASTLDCLIKVRDDQELGTRMSLAKP